MQFVHFTKRVGPWTRERTRGRRPRKIDENNRTEANGTFWRRWRRSARELRVDEDERRRRRKEEDSRHVKNCREGNVLLIKLSLVRSRWCDVVLNRISFLHVHKLLLELLLLHLPPRPSPWTNSSSAWTPFKGSDNTILSGPRIDLNLVKWKWIPHQVLVNWRRESFPVVLWLT